MLKKKRGGGGGEEREDVEGEFLAALLFGCDWIVDLMAGWQT